MTGVPHAIRLHDTEPERLIEVDEMKQRPSASEDLLTAVRTHRPQIGHVVPVEVRRHQTLEVLAVMDDPGNHEGNPCPGGNIDGGRRPLVGMDPPEEDQRDAARADIEGLDVDAVMDRRRVRQRRVPVGIADRHVVNPIRVLQVDGQRGVGGEPVDGGEDRRVNEPGVREWEEVETVVDDVEFGGAFEHGRDMQRLPCLGVEGRVLGVAGGSHTHQPCRGYRIGGRKQRDVDPAVDEALRQ